MSLKIKKNTGAGIHIDEGEYTAIIESVQLKKWEDGGESFAFSFKVKNATLDGDEMDGPVRVTGFATAILTPKSKLTKWAKGAGLDVESDEIDLEDAIGKTVRIYIEDHETKEGAIISRVMTVKPSKKKNEEEEKGKKSKKTDDDDDEKPKQKKSKKDDEDDEDVKPQKKKSKKDDDEDDVKPQKKKSKKDDDEDDVKPQKKKFKKDDDEDDKPKGKSKNDDDDDDDDGLFNFEEDDDED